MRAKEKMSIEILNIPTVEFLKAKLILADQQPEFNIGIREVDALTLSSLCDGFKKDMFSLSGKKLPPATNTSIVCHSLYCKYNIHEQHLCSLESVEMDSSLKCISFTYVEDV